VPQDREQAQQQERPDDVELLLDGERPQVRQRGAAAVERVDPVGAVGERDAQLAERSAQVDRVAAARAARRGGEPRRVVEDQEHRRPHGEHDEERREQPAGPARVEQRQGDAALSAQLVEQHGRDEEAGEHEEDVQTDPPARERTVGAGEVVGHDPDEGQSSQAVEGRRAAEKRCPADAATDRLADGRAHRRRSHRHQRARDCRVLDVCSGMT
jgi:hypothetical protein